MKEIYVAVSGAVSREKQMALVANNLANVNSSGFKRQTAIFEVRPPETDFLALEQSADPRLNLPQATQRLTGDRNYVRMADSYTDFSQGVLRATEHPLDMALESWGDTGGTAFFKIQTPDGVRFTRMGNFARNSDGELVTQTGMRVLSDSNQPIEIGENRNVAVLENGEIAAEGEELGKLGIVIVENPNALERMGHGLWGDRNGQVNSRPLAPDDTVVVRPGFLELSNVNAVEELVRMIEVQRAYGTFDKALSTMDDASGRLVSQMMQ